MPRARELFCLSGVRLLERGLRFGDLRPALASHFAKYRKLVPTLALINHLADVGHGPVGKDAMMRSLGLATSVETHAMTRLRGGARGRDCRRQGNPQLTSGRAISQTAFPPGTCTSAAGRT